MLENLTERFREAFKSITGQSKLTEDNVKDAVRAIKRALLEADVNLAVAKRFVDDVRDKALGAEVLSGVNPAQQFIKIVHDELVALMSDPSSRDDEGRVRINFTRSRPTVVLMAGLQGSGKTTTCAKLAALLVKRNKVKPLLVAADLQRPAAVEQLKVLGKQIGVDVYAEEKSTPPTVCRNALDFARKNANDLIILDTAGRLHVDEALMKEVSEIAKLTEPEEVLLVCDAMTGQDAVKSAKAFDERLPLTGVILTKLDGDARGGAALTVKAVTGKPIKFIGVGEKIEQLEEFFPDRMAGRILGMGDVVTLVEKAQSVIDEKTAVEMEHKLLADEFTMEDFLDQIEAIQKMGPIKDLMKMIPGAANLPMDQFDERGIVHLKALIQSMTVRERRFPDQLSNSRKVRIAKGSGRNVDELNKLLKGFDQMRKMVKAMSQQGILGRVAGYNIKRKRVKRLRNEAKGASKGGARPGLLGGLSGFGGAPGGMKQPTPAEIEAFKKRFKI